MLRRDDSHVLRNALEFEVKGKRKRERPRKTWKMQVEKESRSVGLKKEDALYLLNRVSGEWELKRLLPEWGKSSHPHFGNKPRSKLEYIYFIGFNLKTDKDNLNVQF